MAEAAASSSARRPPPLRPPEPSEDALHADPTRQAGIHAIAVLKPGEGVLVADPRDNVPDHFTMGLHWDVTNGRNIDLDASCLMLDRNFHCVDKVYFGDLNAPGVRHSGDEREGDEKGDDEKIHVNLAAVSPQVKYIGFVINSYSGQELDDVRCSRESRERPEAHACALRLHG